MDVVELELVESVVFYPFDIGLGVEDIVVCHFLDVWDPSTAAAGTQFRDTASFSVHHHYDYSRELLWILGSKRLG